MQSLSSPQSYEQFKQRVKQVIEKSVKLALVFQDVAYREGIEVADDEIQVPWHIFDYSDVAISIYFPSGFLVARAN